MEALLEQFRNSPHAPPVVKDCQTALGNDLYRALLENEILIEVSAEVVFDPQAYAAMLTFVKEEGANPDGLTVAQFRDHFNTSRRYALAFLEYLDASGVTLRQGDVRKIKKANR